MKTNYVGWTRAVLFGAAMLMLPACDRSSDPMGKGDAEFQITDAPSDDASIKGVFVTVADIKVDGKSISGFTKQSIDLKAYQEGNTKLLGTAQLDAKAYNSITLVLDADADASGNSPGCYVLTTDDTKFKLRSSGAINVTASNGWNVVANAKSTIVLDFDLRKSIRQMDDAAIRYNFVSDDNLQGSVRIVSQSSVGNISGSYTEQTSSNADKVIVYAYKKGTFNVSTEVQAQGADAIFFKNAVSSTEVKVGLAGNSYKLAFLEAGDYELHFASYKKDVATNRFMFQTMLKSQTTAGGTIGEFVTLQNGITLSISSTITGTI
jgi:hypothetical protein